MNQFSICGNSRIHLLSVLHGRPQAAARITGGESRPDISGTVRFYQTNEGVVVWAEISGLPLSVRPCQERIFGFHIHKGTDCGGSTDDFLPTPCPTMIQRAVSIRTTPATCRRCLETTALLSLCV